MIRIRCNIIIVASKKWPINNFDVNHGFLHEDLHEEVFLKMPKGFPNPNNQVCKLRNSLYGLKHTLDNGLQNFIKDIINP